MRGVLLVVLSLSVCLVHRCDAAQSVALVQTMRDIWKTLGGVTCDASMSYPTQISNARGILGFYLNGTIPSSIGTLTNLTRFHMGANLYISGTIPPSICNLTNMYYLNLGTNQLTGTIPSCLAKITILQTLYLDHNQLSGSIPDMFGSLINLQTLYIYHNRFSGSIPSSIGQCSMLSSLYLAENNLTGTVPQVIIDMPSLTFLNISYNQLNGSLPARSSSLPPLATLVVNYNQFTSIGYINVTTTCKLNYNYQCKSGTLPVYPSVCTVDVIPNCGSPTLVALGRVWQSMNGDSSLWKSQNYCNSVDFQGVVCDSQANVLGISVHNVSRAIYSGFRPPLYPILSNAICNVTSLNNLDLGSNALTGGIPSCLGGMNITQLYLNDNNFTGSIPSTIINLPQLTVLDFSHNHLDGAVPNRNVQLHQLTTLRLNDNNFTSAGYVDSSTCDMTSNPFPCYPFLTISPSCTFSYLPCTSFDVELTRLYDNKTVISAKQAEVILNTQASSGEPRTVQLITAVVPALLHNTTSFDYTSKIVNLTVQTFYPGVKDNGTSVTCEIVNSGVSASLPLSIVQQAQVSLAISSLSFNPFTLSDNQSVYSQVIGVTVYDKRGGEIQIRDDSESVNISMGSIQFVPSGYEPVCQWWNETMKGWSREGCRLVQEASVGVCQCNHLTNFSIGVAPVAPQPDQNKNSPADTNRTTLIIIIACAAGGGIIVIAIISILVYRLASTKRSKNAFEEIECEVKHQLEWKEKVYEGKKSQVWKAIENGTTTVAVKKSGGKDNRSLIEEAIRLKGMHHPNIVMFLGQNLSEGWLMMEWMEDGSLYSFSQVRPVASFVYSIGKEVAQAMAYVAEQSIVHTQLNPHHVLLQATHDVITAKITGFCECVADGGEYYKKAKDHTAPEVIESHMQRTSADVWSFGVLLSFIASNGKIESRGKRRTARGSVTIDDGWETTLKAMIQDCTVSDADMRPNFTEIARRMTRDTVRADEEPKSFVGKAFDPYAMNS
ncbi:putative LRR receptor-like serine/threonine-protein kinase [Planoprotostelium fungivorum]|uniref:Putative LRR receptor-like serine/threonine-protein kinase n=1 Tax=Planoprotostelium fungivorum TaxID=1890364 RepID=A0A2P6N9S8_9EUKA|nr:putative LRR receptor-like serine/threonine-protein kinase [Planoprotostelium fungivorum]